MVENAAKMGTFVATKRKVRNPILNLLILFTCFLLAHVIAQNISFKKLERNCYSCQHYTVVHSHF